MKRLALISALTAFAACGFSQGPPDVPQNHWAHRAVADLYRLGILVGYPDGLYRGSRPASRFEMAQAISAFRSHNLVEFDRLKAAIEDLKEPQRDIDGLADIRRRLDALEQGAARIQALRPDIDDLQKRFESMNEELRRIRESLRSTREKIPPRG